MRSFMFLMTAALLVIGCGPPKFKPTKPTERIGGVISQIHDKVDEIQVAEMLKDLHLHILQEESTGQMPTPDQVREYGKKENRKLGEMIDKGWIIIPPKITRGSIWAYQRDTAEKGGWVIVQAGPKKVSAEEFREMGGK